MNDRELYDVAIVGAGLAGLAAAEQLADRRMVMLEKKPHAGGARFPRPATVLGSDAESVWVLEPRPASTRGSAESDRIGLFSQGALHFGASPLECLQGLAFSPAEKGALEAFAVAAQPDVAALPPALRRPLESFFQLVHPGDLGEVLSPRQRDALTPLAVRRYPASDLPFEAQAQRLGSKLWLDTQVLAVVEKPRMVEVVYQRGGERRTLGARTVICATSAATTRELIPLITNDRCRVFLEALRYQSGTLVELELSGYELPDFGVLATPELAFNAVLRLGARFGKKPRLIFQYLGEEAKKIAGLPREALAQRVLQQAKPLKLGQVEVSAAETRPWIPSGPVISAASYGRWHDWEARASERVYLAGPHVWVDGEVDQERRAGKKTAQKIEAYLDVEPEFDRLRSSYLVETSLYHMVGDRPVIVRTKQEGNVAFYGLVLQATRDPAIARYLMHSNRRGLWEYQVGFGTTGEDSLLALEGLLSHGWDRAQLEDSAAKLVDAFYSPRHRCFLTISEKRHEMKDVAQGLAEYWYGPSLDATSAAAWFLHQIDPQRYQEEIRAARDYVVHTQRPDGLWVGLWFPSFLVSTFYSVRALAVTGKGHPESEAAMRRAGETLLGSQAVHGSWNDSVIDTSTAVLTLGLLGKGRGEAAQRGRAWLTAQRGPHGWDGEPVTYYWYELQPGERLFFHCRDRGQITTAWATLALAE